MTDEEVRCFLKHSDRIMYPMTEKEREKMFIERWRVRELFREAYIRYQQQAK